MSFSNKSEPEFWEEILVGYRLFLNELENGYENSDIKISKVGSYPAIQLLDDLQQADVFKVESKKHHVSYNACVWLFYRKISSNASIILRLPENHTIMQVRLELLPENEVSNLHIIKSLNIDKHDLKVSKEINDYLDGKGENEQNQKSRKKVGFYDLISMNYTVPTLFKYHVTKWCER